MSLSGLPSAASGRAISNVEQAQDNAEDSLLRLGMRLCKHCNGWFKSKGITGHTKACMNKAELKRKDQEYEEMIAKRGMYSPNLAMLKLLTSAKCAVRCSALTLVDAFG